MCECVCACLPVCMCVRGCLCACLVPVCARVRVRAYVYGEAVSNLLLHSQCVDEDEATRTETQPLREVRILLRARPPLTKKKRTLQVYPLFFIRGGIFYNLQ